MYLPKQFEQSEMQRIISLVDEYAFATVVSLDKGIPYANHLPLMIDAADDLVITGHMARANAQWRHFQNGLEILTIFQGPHAYISPSNYEGPGVPTWNYAAIHMYGKCSVIEDKHRLKSIINALSHKFERYQESPWVPEYSSELLNAIVGFELNVTRIEAKYKLSQNRSDTDRKNIILNLSKSDSEGAKGIAGLMCNSI